MSYEAGERVFREAGRYLLAAGWERDGDDEGIWGDPKSSSPMLRWMPIGEALEVQWDRDGVSMQGEAG